MRELTGPDAVALAAAQTARAAPLLVLDPAQPVLCIFHHGARSAQVVAFLERMGFTSAYNLAGGIAAWLRDVDPGVARY